MPSSNHLSQPGPALSAAIGQLAERLLGVAISCALGLLIAMSVGRALRRRHLHWSWAAILLTPVALAPSALGSWSLTLGVAGAAAVAWGRRWHREDLEAGADLARLASERRSPADALLGVLARVELRRRMTAGGAWLRGGRLLLGADQSSRPISIPFGAELGGRHTLVVGGDRLGPADLGQPFAALLETQHRLQGKGEALHGR